MGSRRERSGPPAAGLWRSGGCSRAARRHRRRPCTGNLGRPSRARGRPGAAATPWPGAPGRNRETWATPSGPIVWRALLAHQPRLPRQPRTRSLTHAGHSPESTPDARHPPTPPRTRGTRLHPPGRGTPISTSPNVGQQPASSQMRDTCLQVLGGCSRRLQAISTRVSGWIMGLLHVT